MTASSVGAQQRIGFAHQRQAGQPSQDVDEFADRIGVIGADIVRLARNPSLGQRDQRGDRVAHIEDRATGLDVADAQRTASMPNAHNSPGEVGYDIIALAWPGCVENAGTDA